MNTLNLKILFSILLGFASINIAAQPQSESLVLPEFSKEQFSNGARWFYLKHDEVPLVELSISIGAGSVHDGAAQGLAALTAEALSLGLEGMTKQEFQSRMDFLGVRWDFSADQERTTLNFSMAKKDFAEVAKIAAGIVMAPRFEETEFVALKARWLSEIDRKFESPASIIQRYMMRSLFGHDPLGNSVDGTKTSVADILREDLVEFHKKFYRPEYTRIIVVGDLTKSEAQKVITEQFQRKTWGQDSKKVPEISYGNPSKVSEGTVILVDKPDATQATFLIGGHTVAANFPELTQAGVVNTILGGRFTSWLNDELRVKSGLTYGARSALNTFKSNGTFVISSHTKTESAGEAIKMAFDVYKKLFSQGISSEDLNSGINYVEGQFPPKFETPSHLSNLIDDVTFYDLNYEKYRNMSAQLRSLDSTKVKTLIPKVFPKNPLVLVVIGSADKLKEPLKAFGQVRVVSIKDQDFSI